MVVRVKVYRNEDNVMNGALPETKYISGKLLCDSQKSIIEEFIKNVEEKGGKYETVDLWSMDRAIGGIGGYSMPSDPKLNPYPGGINRELFRPLQYVRSEIDICDIRMHARQVVHYSGMHLETVIRLFLKNRKPMGNLRFFNSTLGKAAQQISKMNIFDDDLIDSLFKFVVLYNKAKHEVNINESRPRMFTIEDAIVCYFAARIIGQAILIELKYPLALNVYEIIN